MALNCLLFKALSVIKISVVDKKKLYCLSVFFLLFFQIGTCQNMGFWQKWIQYRLHGKALPNSGPEPDYSNLYYWAASPYKHDPSDSIPSFLADEKRNLVADVFYIHPTTFFGDLKGVNIESTGKKDWIRLAQQLPQVSWNANLNDKQLNRQTDLWPILFQASVFNGCCRVFAPRYRQANIKAFFAPNSPEAKQALDLAYSDVKKAFEYYLLHENNNRPIVIASHSQGSLLAIRLLQEFFDGKPLQNQLVCAYVIGHRVPRNTFKKIPIGYTRMATNCFVTWRTFQKGEIPASIKKENGDAWCVNPLTWKTDAAWAPKDLNLGALLDFHRNSPHYVSAGIEPKSKILWVSLPNDADKNLKKIKNFHIFDYTFFWMNIRENVKTRVDVYLRLHPQSEKSNK